MDRIEEGLDQIEKSAEARDYFLPVIILRRSMPSFPKQEQIFSHPRFKALEAKMNP
jgi:hypothetical protein